MCDEEVQARLERMTEVANSWTANTLEELAKKAKDDNEDVRSIAASRLMNLEDSRAVPFLTELMADPFAKVRGMAALGLGHYKAPESRDILIAHLKQDESRDVRAMCAKSLGWIGDVDDELVNALDDPDWHVKISAIPTLHDKRKSFPEERILGLLDDPEWQVRYFACCALVDFGIGDERIAKTLLELRNIPEAKEQVDWFAESDVWMAACEKFGDEIPEFDEDAKMESEPDITAILTRLREKHGEEEVPYPSQDPLGDLAARAEELYRKKSR
ncbi:MAG: HEAT repeat domain-containing protein [Armatimonadota bacterium]